MTDYVVEWLTGAPPALATVLLAALPVGELRVALPMALLVYDLPMPWALALSIFGNMLPVYFLLVGFERASAWARRVSPLIDWLLKKLFERTRRRLSARVQRYEYWALAAFVFGLPRWRSLTAILVGVCVAAVIVAALTLGASKAINGILN